MDIIIVLLILIVVILIIWYFSFLKNERLLQLLMVIKPYEKDFSGAIDDFRALGKWYISDSQYQQWKIKYKYLFKLINSNSLNAKTDDPFKDLVLKFFNCYQYGRSLYIDKFNNKFIDKEVPIIKSILDSKNIPNNEDQLTAIASDEDNTLLVAGAGTGKTTTILGKLAYLLERVKVNPEEILLLSFTGRAVDELSSRISQKFNDVNLKVKTFHSFGLSILSKGMGKKPGLAFSRRSEMETFVNNEFNKLLKDKSYLHKAIEYFAYYFKPVIIELGFQNYDEYYKYIKSEEILTLKKELVKSQQELMIANFLYLNGVKYIYEAPYKYETADKSYSQYRPDFYLPEYDIYIEHFGINKDGETKYTKDKEQNRLHTERYRQQMDWKRELHDKYGTRLLETYSYEFTRKTWRKNLSKKLSENGVKFSPVNSQEVYSLLTSTTTVKQMVLLFDVFLGLSKSNDFSLKRISDRIETRNIERESVFFDLFSPIYKSYENYLDKIKGIDFHDMIIKAAKFINEGKVSIKLKYIIIDEFQDFSVSKYNLIKALCDQNPEVKLFCVGDDWQSIFRFTGSDISLMTNFEEAYGFTRKKQLVMTNRFNDRLAVVSNRFILKNPYQINKEVQANKHVTNESVEVVSNKYANDKDHLLREILDTLNKNSIAANNISSVFILGRYKFNEPRMLEEYKQDFKKLSIEFLTIHASKGSEADYVIILDVITDKFGFPTGVTDDPILDIVLSKDEFYPHAEERRLMYVAMTRARNKVYIMTEDGKKSIFVLELEGSKRSDDNLVRCEECAGEMVLRKGRYGLFYGCTNFPDCRYTKKVD